MLTDYMLKTQYTADCLQELALASEWVNIDAWRKRVMSYLQCPVNVVDSYIVEMKDYLIVNKINRSYKAAKQFNASEHVFTGDSK